MEDWRHGGFGLYLHWPFCQSKCPYCDFNSHVSANIEQQRWKTAYLSEIDRAGRETPGRTLDTVFFGGGTPSLMDPDLVAAIIDRIRRTWPMANDPEITLEANPGSVEAARFRDFRDAGVNRISMGMQAMRDADLKRLGRLHTAAEARAAFGVARSLFARVNFDLIYARQDQSLGEWRAELSEALDLAVDHLSLYQLTIEDGTAFGDRFARGLLRGLPDDDLSADMYSLTQELCEAAGMPAYEVSNHAKPGSESKHNLIYWRGGDYIGIGPGAHGRLTLGGTRWATVAPKAPGAWLAMVEGEKQGEYPRSAIFGRDRAEEYLLMALRLTEGMCLDRFAAHAGTEIDPDRLEHLEGLGLLGVSNRRVIATAAGRMVLNGIIRDLAMS